MQKFKGLIEIYLLQKLIQVNCVSWLFRLKSSKTCRNQVKHAETERNWLKSNETGRNQRKSSSETERNWKKLDEIEFWNRRKQKETGRSRVIQDVSDRLRTKPEQNGRNLESWLEHLNIFNKIIINYLLDMLLTHPMELLMPQKLI